MNLTIEIELTKFSRVRISRSPKLKALGGPKATTRTVETEAAPLSESFISIEALVPRGARAEYGFVGILYRPATIGVLRASAYGATVPSAAWAESLAGSLDEVHVGLADEYVDGVLDGLLRAPTPPAGEVVVVEAAHGLVGSSARFFAQVALGAMTLLHIAESDVTSRFVNAQLRAILKT